MTDQGVQQEAPASLPEGGEATPTKQPRERSTIQFPYDDLVAAESIALAVHTGYGGRATREQIAAELDVKATSGAFRNKLSAARMFGFVTMNRDDVEVTDLGIALADPTTASGARVRGFFNVELYSALHERFRGGVLPSNQGLEATIRELGVATKQAATARQAFLRSAEQAGFFRKGRTRLVVPPTKLDEQQPPGPKPNEHGPPDGEKEEPGMQADPLLASLFRKLPPVTQGFDLEQRRNFVNALDAIFTIVYGPPDGSDMSGPNGEPAEMPPSVLRG